MDLFSPEYAAQFGPYCFQSGLAIDVVSCQDSSFDWACIRFTHQLQEAVTLAKMDEVVISMGYDGVFYPVFQGYVVNDFTLSDGAGELLARDAAVKLEAVAISCTFMQVQPAEVIEYCCRQAELDYKVSEAQYQQRDHPVFGESALKVVEGLAAAWGITAPIFVRDGVLHWGMPSTQTQLYIFEHSKNIISLAKASGYWCMETVSTPFVRHSDRIGVRHPQLTGEFEVYKVAFSSTEQGFLRTNIYFKEDKFER